MKRQKEELFLERQIYFFDGHILYQSQESMKTDFYILYDRPPVIIYRMHDKKMRPSGRKEIHHCIISFMALKALV